MIIIFHPPDSNKVALWGERLDKILIKYELVESKWGAPPRLVDGEKRTEGYSAIDAYLDELEAFVEDVELTGTINMSSIRVRRVLAINPILPNE